MNSTLRFAMFALTMVGILGLVFLGQQTMADAVPKCPDEEIKSIDCPGPVMTCVAPVRDPLDPTKLNCSGTGEYLRQDLFDPNQKNAMIVGSQPGPKKVDRQLCKTTHRCMLTRDKTKCVPDTAERRSAEYKEWAYTNEKCPNPVPVP